MDNTGSTPTRLTDEDLREFIAIYKKEFGIPLSLAEAREIAMPLLELYAQLAKPLPSEKARVSNDNQSSTPITMPPKMIDILKFKRPEK